MNIFFKSNISFNNCILDKYQRRAVLYSKGDYLIIAGAGSGKTLTIASKIDYLIKSGISPKDILCISFTNETVNSLKNILIKNNIDVMVLTYHKLAISILNTKYGYSSNYLDYIATEYFYSYIYRDNCYRLFDFLTKGKDKEKYIEYYVKNITSFINTMKVYNKSISDILSLFKLSLSYEEKCILLFAIKIYSLYEEELRSVNRIDFNDMINLANKEVDNLNNFRYKYIIIDEYQDISYSKYSLIKKLKDKFNIRLIAVGDDYQSIYGFSGCNVKYILHFKDMFKNSKVIKLKNNYRSSKDIVEISKRFVLKNKEQIKKRLISNKNIKYAINIIYSNDFKKTIKEITKDIDNILVIGRNNRDIEYLKDISINKNIRYLTVHKSKGLEEDYVIIVNVIDDILGFPNKISNSLVRFIDYSNIIEYEERRLFYVALTRAKKKVYILTVLKKESIYVKELIKEYRYKIKIFK